MKKVVCARCGLVNLNKFVSFPHCAACGALLPQQQPSFNRWRGLGKRRVRPLYWMLAVGSGLGMLGLAIASVARETRARNDKPLLVYSQIPRTAAPGQTVKAQFTLDSALENPDDNFQLVSLRLGDDTQRKWVIVNVNPAPDSSEMRGRGRYYLWDELPRNTTIVITLQARATGVLPLHATLWAAQYQQFEVRASLNTANTATRGTASGAPKKAAPSMQTPAKVAK